MRDKLGYMFGGCVILALTIFLHTKNAWLFVFLYSLVYGGYGMLLTMVDYIQATAFNPGVKEG